MQLQPGIESSQKRFDALCFFQIVKERNSPGSKARRQGALPRPRAWVPQWDGGGERDRTDDLLLAKQALSQLSYTPVKLGKAGRWWVWLDSNQRPPPYQDGALTG